MTSTTDIMGNFTPVPDALVSQYGLTAAAIWGRIWRYSCGERRVCDAAVSTIATELGLSRETVRVYINALEGDGYIVDLTPDAKTKPHAYVITRKITIELRLEVGESALARNSDKHLPENLAPLAGNSGTKRQVTDNSKRQIRRVKERDPLLDHPGVTVYHEVTGRHFAITLRKSVCETVTNPTLWRQIITEWVGNGWNPRNLNGLLDAYKRGGISSNHKSTVAPNAPSWRPMTEEEKAELRRQMKELQEA